MTISSNTRQAGPFTGNGSADRFAFEFKIFDVDDLVVIKTTIADGTDEVLTGSDYSVELNANQNSSPGGEVVLTANLAEGYRLTLTSGVENQQPIDLTNQGGFYPSVINDAFDRATIQVQQLQNSVDRSVKIPISDDITGDIVLPSKEVRSGKVLAFDDSTGLPEAGPEIADVESLANITADIALLADIEDGTLDTNAITTVSGIHGDVTTVSAIHGDVTTVANLDEGAVNTVAANDSNVTIVADAINNVNKYADTYFISATAPESPTQGDLWYDTDEDVLKIYTSSYWAEAATAVNGVRTNENYEVGITSYSSTGVTYSGSTSTFPAVYDVGYVDVFLNGIKLTPSDYTATTGTEVVFNSPAASGDEVTIIGYGIFEFADFGIGSARDVNLVDLEDGDILRYRSAIEQFAAEKLNYLGGDVAVRASTSNSVDKKVWYKDDGLAFSFSNTAGWPIGTSYILINASCDFYSKITSFQSGISKTIGIVKPMHMVTCQLLQKGSTSALEDVWALEEHKLQGSITVASKWTPWADELTPDYSSSFYTAALGNAALSGVNPHLMWGFFSYFESPNQYCKFKVFKHDGYEHEFITYAEASSTTMLSQRQAHKPYDSYIGNSAQQVIIAGRAAGGTYGFPQLRYYDITDAENTGAIAGASTTSLGSPSFYANAIYRHGSYGTGISVYSKYVIDATSANDSDKHHFRSVEMDTTLGAVLHGTTTVIDLGNQINSGAMSMHNIGWTGNRENYYLMSYMHGTSTASDWQDNLSIRSYPVYDDTQTTASGGSTLGIIRTSAAVTALDNVCSTAIGSISLGLVNGYRWSAVAGIVQDPTTKICKLAIRFIRQPTTNTTMTLDLGPTEYFELDGEPVFQTDLLMSGYSDMIHIMLNTPSGTKNIYTLHFDDANLSLTNSAILGRSISEVSDRQHYVQSGESLYVDAEGVLGCYTENYSDGQDKSKLMFFNGYASKPQYGRL